MTIRLHLDNLIEKRQMTVTYLAKAVGISRVNMSNLKTGKVKAIRFSTLDEICKQLNCQPGDILEYIPDEAE